jgi:glycine/D-amino acid oxidase-like deaminating enzyme
VLSPRSASPAARAGRQDRNGRLRGQRASVVEIVVGWRYGGSARFDVVVFGGGLAGSSLAITLAQEGVDVLVVERERVFRDRVRGEVMAPWGTVEAKRLDLYELLRKRCAIDVRYLRRAAHEYAEQHDEYCERLHRAERLSAATLMSVGPDGASRRARALEIFDRVPELETWTFGPEAHCDDAVRTELLA